MDETYIIRCDLEDREVEKHFEELQEKGLLKKMLKVTKNHYVPVEWVSEEQGEN